MYVSKHACMSCDVMEIVHVCTYACMHECMYVCVSVLCVHACMYVCMCVCTCMHACMYARIYNVRMRVYICLYGCVRVCTYVSMFTHVHTCKTCVHTCIHACMDASIHTYTTCMSACMHTNVHTCIYEIEQTTNPKQKKNILVTKLRLQVFAEFWRANPHNNATTTTKSTTAEIPMCSGCEFEQRRRAPVRACLTMSPRAFSQCRRVCF